MTPEAAIWQFMGSFGIPAYASSSVPEDAQFPYLTYDLVMGTWMGGEVNVPVNLWYKTESEAEPNAKVREMSDAIGLGGVTLPCDNGFIWIKRGSPWAQAVVTQESDARIRRRYINIDIEYMTI